MSVETVREQTPIIPESLLALEEQHTFSSFQKWNTEIPKWFQNNTNLYSQPIAKQVNLLKQIIIDLQNKLKQLQSKQESLHKFSNKLNKDTTNLIKTVTISIYL